MIYFNFDELEIRKEESRQLRQLVYKLAEENTKLMGENKRLKEENERLRRIIRIFAGEEKTILKQ
ncbi:hypothetical protein THYS13_15050 [Thermoanaerobacter sp. YS13]|uniref:hypothetical protein n=1 Tax=Thermoanaerobacter sp. YS13 TaxID=1511746 RepID=UPI000573D97B|nr:hypothetical protein [Thermoanaerobacter sp. YS13]KHO63379.1 hypothetical protein THYS13_15050 [Thermoanaerobacter sp. YS13]